MTSPYLRAAARLRAQAALKLQARLDEEATEAIEVIDVAVIERACDANGQFIPDDLTTSDVDEAWVEVPQE
jgi:hypothetical protein